MCISIPALVKAIEAPGKAAVLVDGRLLQVVLAVPDVHPGDWVLLHGGIAIRSIDKATAAEIRSYFSDGQIPSAAIET